MVEDIRDKIEPMDLAFAKLVAPAFGITAEDVLLAIDMGIGPDEFLKQRNKELGTKSINKEGIV